MDLQINITIDSFCGHQYSIQIIMMITKKKYSNCFGHLYLLWAGFSTAFNYAKVTDILIALISYLVIN